MKKKCFFGIFLCLILLFGGIFLLIHSNLSNTSNNLENQEITNAAQVPFLITTNLYGLGPSGVIGGDHVSHITYRYAVGSSSSPQDYKQEIISSKTLTNNSYSETFYDNSVWFNWHRWFICGTIRTGSFTDVYDYRVDLSYLADDGSNGITWENIVIGNEYHQNCGDDAERGCSWTVNIYLRIEYDVNLNGADYGPGQTSATLKFIYDTYDQRIEDADGNERSNITLPERPGYTFQGYYTASSGGTQIINSSGQWTGNWNRWSAQPADLYAQWTINSYKSDVNFYDPNNQQQGGTFDLYRKINGKEELLDDDANNEVGGEEWLQYNGQWILRDIHPNTGTHITNVSLSGGGAISVTGTAPNITEIIYTANQTYAPKPNWDGTVNIYTAWNTYKVRYNANGGTGMMTDQSFTYNTAQNLKSNTFKRAGYYFTGWNGNGTNYTNGQSVINLTTTHNSTIDFYAQWEPYVFTYSFDTDGGSTHAGGTAAYGSSITLPKPDKIGYTFKGWQHSINGNTYQDGSYSVNDTENSNATVVFTAIWQANTYTTTFHDGEGAVTNFADMMITNYNYTYSNNEYSYTVNGVTITYENGTGTLTLNGTPTNAFTIFINTDLSFKQNEQYSVKYTKQEGNMTGETSGCFVLEICDENWANLSTRNHLDFQMNASSGEAKLTVNESGATYGKGLRLWFWFNTNATPARVFNNFKIKITLEKLGENQSVIKTGKVTYDSQLRGVSIPSKIGHTFNGYYNSQSGGKQYYKATGVAITKTWKETNNITLYARWTPHSYTIVFNGNGSTSGSTSSKKATYDSDVELSTNGFKRTGYVFTGWNTKSDGKGKSYLDKATVKNLTSVDGATITLYAQWEETWANHTSSSLETTEINGVTYNVIASAEDLAYLSKQSISSTLLGKYIQTADIDLSDYTWLPIGSEHAFCGEYLGQGHKITGLHTSDAKNAKGVYLQTYGGLFGKLGENSTTDASANIVGVYITDCLVYGQYSGAIAGFSDVDSVNIEACIEACILENVKIYGNTNTTASFVGSSSDGQIKDCLLISSNISTANATTRGFYTGSMTVNSSYYMNGTTPTQFYTSGASNDYSNWVTGVFKYPLPKALIWYPGA